VVDPISITGFDEFLNFRIPSALRDEIR